MSFLCQMAATNSDVDGVVSIIGLVNEGKFGYYQWHLDPMKRRLETLQAKRPNCDKIKRALQIVTKTNFRGPWLQNCSPEEKEIVRECAKASELRKEQRRLETGGDGEESDSASEESDCEVERTTSREEANQLCQYYDNIFKKSPVEALVQLNVDPEKVPSPNVPPSPQTAPLPKALSDDLWAIINVIRDVNGGEYGYKSWHVSPMIKRLDMWKRNYPNCGNIMQAHQMVKKLCQNDCDLSDNERKIVEMCSDSDLDPPSGDSKTDEKGDDSHFFEVVGRYLLSDNAKKCCEACQESVSVNVSASTLAPAKTTSPKVNLGVRPSAGPPKPPKFCSYCKANQLLPGYNGKFCSDYCREESGKQRHKVNRNAKKPRHENKENK